MIGSSNAVSPDPMDYLNFTVDLKAIGVVGGSPSNWYKQGLVKWENISQTPTFIIPESVDSLYGLFQYTNIIKCKLTGGGSVTRVDNMFYGCEQLEEVDMAEFDMSTLEHAYSLATECASLKRIDVGTQDTPSLTTTHYMFSRCAQLVNVDFHNWAANALETVHGMFNGCVSLEHVDLSGWRTSNVTNMMGFFTNCSSLQYVNLSGWTTESVTNSSTMFSRTRVIEAVVIDSPSVFTITDSSAFRGSSIKNGGTGFVYVPDSLVDEYKTATNWTTVADQIKPLSELPQEVKDVFHM